AQAAAVHRIRSGHHPGHQQSERRRRPAVRPPDADRCEEKFRAAPRLRLAPERRSTPRHPRRLRHVLHADSVESHRQLSRERTGWITSYTATPGQLGFPTCLTGSCLPLSFDPKTLPASQLPARDIVIQAGRRAFYEAQFAKFGLNFDKLPFYPAELVNPKSQVMSLGAKLEF